MAIPPCALAGPLAPSDLIAKPCRKPMNEKLILILLIPYALGLIWGLKRFGLNGPEALWLWLVTVVFVWAVLYATFSMSLFPDPDQAFASVEYIMRDVEYDWVLRYVSERFGWLVASAYFGLCYGIAWLYPSKK